MCYFWEWCEISWRWIKCFTPSFKILNFSYLKLKIIHDILLTLFFFRSICLLPLFAEVKNTESIMSTTSELACVYASLILQDEGLEISATNINKLIKAAEVSVEPIWPTLFAKNMSSETIEGMLTSVGSG